MHNLTEAEFETLSADPNARKPKVNPAARRRESERRREQVRLAGVLLQVASQNEKKR